MSNIISIVIDIGDKTYRKEGFIPLSKKGTPRRVVEYHLNNLLGQVHEDIKKDFVE